jgi:hypothetical protein
MYFLNLSFSLILLIGSFVFAQTSPEAFSKRNQQIDQNFKKSYNQKGEESSVRNNGDPTSPSQTSPEPRSPSQGYPEPTSPSQKQSKRPSNAEVENSSKNLLVPEDRNNVVDPSAD